MATINRPTFPDPALEVGVAQYPTPVVPDYYTKDGHIILVEKVSIEKGNYNPQPLDGSVIYDKRDANDWPENLYLVFQQNEPTGKFVFNYWANDRTLASQDPWNYGLQYSLNHPNFKIVTRSYITPREDYTPVALGAVDPVFGGNAIISQQQMAELPDDNPLRSRYVQVQRVYETIPSSVITGKRVTERGDIETLETQVVVAGTSPDADGLLVTQTSVEAVDAVKSKRTKGSVTSYSTLSSQAKKAGLLGEVTITDAIVSAGSSPDSLSLTILDSSVEAMSATKSRKRTTTASGPTSLVGYQYDEFFEQRLTITESIVAPDAAAPSFGSGVLSYRDEPIDSQKSKRSVVTTPNLPPTRTEYKTGTYTSPLLVFDIDFTQANMACAGSLDIRIKLTPITRGSQSGPTTFKTVTSYSYGFPTPAGDTGIFSPKLREVSFTGFVINFNLGAALCDNITSGSPGVPVQECGEPFDPVYETWDIPATTPTATEYLAKVNSGNYEKISWESRYWKAGIWESKTIYVKLI
jgi:hypothetical protein